VVMASVGWVPELVVQNEPLLVPSGPLSNQVQVQTQRAHSVVACGCSLRCPVRVQHAPAECLMKHLLAVALDVISSILLRHCQLDCASAPLVLVHDAYTYVGKPTHAGAQQFRCPVPCHCLARSAVSLQYRALQSALRPSTGAKRSSDAVIDMPIYRDTVGSCRSQLDASQQKKSRFSAPNQQSQGASSHVAAPFRQPGVVPVTLPAIKSQSGHALIHLVAGMQQNQTAPMASASGSQGLHRPRAPHASSGQASAAGRANTFSAAEPGERCLQLATTAKCHPQLPGAHAFSACCRHRCEANQCTPPSWWGVLHSACEDVCKTGGHCLDVWLAHVSVIGFVCVAMWWYGHV
jgi:hypothetical protein